MTQNQGRGWHGDPEGHAEAARARDKMNWWPLLFIPLAFFVGYVSNEGINRAQNQAYDTQVGVGGGPNTPCVSPMYQ